MIEGVPAGRAEVAQVAVPLLSSAGGLPVQVTGLPLLSAKDTAPVGVPAPGATAATVVVNVTGWPKTDGLTDEEETTVVVDALFTFRGKAADVLPAKLESAW